MSSSPDGKYVVTAFGTKVKIFPIKFLSEILDKWSDILGSNTELAPEEKEKCYIN